MEYASERNKPGAVQGRSGKSTVDNPPWPLLVAVARGACFLACMGSPGSADARQHPVPRAAPMRAQRVCSEASTHKNAPGKPAPHRAMRRKPGRGEIVDSSLTLTAALSGEAIPDAIRRDLTLVTVSYWSFDHRVHRGQIVIHKDLASDVRAIFRELRWRRFPIAHVVPVVRYGWSDEASMAANNTSGFNYRTVPGQTKLSNHAYGRAVDINPVQNPYMQQGVASPPGAVYDPAQPGTITDGPIVRAFEKRGWRWGGRWRIETDWQHFDKKPTLQKKDTAQ